MEETVRMNFEGEEVEVSPEWLERFQQGGGILLLPPANKASSKQLDGAQATQE